MICYLDNAATTYPKPKCVCRAYRRCLEETPGNAGRSSHKLSVQTAEAIYSCREAVAELLSFNSPEGVVFTYNATHALNLAIKAYIKNGSHVIISDIEHNAVVRPLERLKKENNIEVDVFDSEGDIESSVKKLIKDNTTSIVSTIASNVTGKTVSLDSLSKIAKTNGLMLIVDASQALGHYEIDLSKTPCDVLCGPGHKGLYGIQGVGFAVFSDPERKGSLIEGGSGADSINTEMPYYLPEGYEAGTLGAPAIYTLKSGVDFVKSVGVSNIEKRLRELTNRLYERISSLPKIRIHSCGNGILCFNHESISSSDMASLLDDKSIYVRSGLHCAPSAHRKLDTLECGAVRASLSFLNTTRDIDRIYSALKDITFLY